MTTSSTAPTRPTDKAPVKSFWKAGETYYFHDGRFIAGHANFCTNGNPFNNHWYAFTLADQQDHDNLTWREVLALFGVDNTARTDDL